MSADRWSVCPRCKRRRQAKANAAAEDAREAYGKVSVEEFDRLRAAAETLQRGVTEADLTFREDYQVTGIEDEEVAVSYFGRCTTCGLEVAFEHRHPVRWGP